MNKNIFIHIGLGKTSTTTLQKHIFPELSKDLNYEFIDEKKLFKLIKMGNNFINNIDCLDKIKFLLNNKKKIEEISSNGQKRTLKDHTAKVRIEQINYKISKFL